MTRLLNGDQIAFGNDGATTGSYFHKARVNCLNVSGLGKLLFLRFCLSAGRGAFGATGGLGGLCRIISVRP